MVSEVKKRDGKVEPFDKEKIARAIMRAMSEVGEPDVEVIDRIVAKIA